jgi:hypothetical protein
MTSTNPPRGDVYFNTPGVASVKWDRAARTVLVEWEGWADTKEFTTLLTAGVQALTDHHGSRWLADCRRQRVLKPSDQEWGDTVWLPQALAAGLKRFAVVLPSSILATMNLKDKEGIMRTQGLDVEYFATVEEAREWLAAM